MGDAAGFEEVEDFAGVAWGEGDDDAGLRLVEEGDIGAGASSRQASAIVWPEVGWEGIEQHRRDRAEPQSSRQLGVVLNYRRSDLLFFFEQLAEITGGLNVEPELSALPEEFAEFERHFGRDVAATENDFVDASRADAKCSCERVLGNAHGHEIVYEQNFTGSDSCLHSLYPIAL